LHRVEIHPAQGDVFRLLIGCHYHVEALRLAGCLGDRGLPRALCLGDDTCRLTACPRDDIVVIGLGLVAHALGVRIRTLHIDLAFDDRSWPVDLLQLHLSYFDPDIISIENFLGLRRFRSARAIERAPARSAFGL